MLNVNLRFQKPFLVFIEHVFSFEQIGLVYLYGKHSFNSILILHRNILKSSERFFRISWSSDGSNLQYKGKLKLTFKFTSLAIRIQTGYFSAVRNNLLESWWDLLLCLQWISFYLYQWYLHYVKEQAPKFSRKSRKFWMEFSSNSNVIFHEDNFSKFQISLLRQQC